MKNEPVAWMETYCGKPNNLVWSVKEAETIHPYGVIPLYAHPVKELTDEEIELLETEIFVKDAILKSYKEALEQIATGEIANESTNYKDTVYVMRKIASDALAILRKTKDI